jgi:hypothetical protein
LRITSDIGHGLPRGEYARHYAERIVLQYTSPAEHPRLPEYAARLGHLSLSAAATAAAELALVSLMQALAAEGLVCQAYVAPWDGDDEPNRTLYERAADIHVHQKAARGWGTRYLRAVADRLWLGPEFAAMLPDRAALERVAVVSQIGNALAIERRPEATLRDIELCLEPMLASKAESQVALRSRPRSRSWQPSRLGAERLLGNGKRALHERLGLGIMVFSSSARRCAPPPLRVRAPHPA